MRALLTTLLMLLALPAHALCGGPGIMDRLDATDRAAVAQAVADTPYPSGTLFSATRDGREITLVGTLHIHDPRLLPLANRVASRVAAADLLLVEAGPEEEAALTRAMATDPTLLFLSDGSTLPEQLDEPTWQALIAAASSRGVPAMLAAKMQPWYLSLLLSIPPCAMGDLNAGATGLDAMIVAQAETGGVPVQALEPWQTLFDVMRAPPLSEQVDQLRFALVPADLHDAMFASMLDSYFAGDIAELWEVSRAAMRLVPGIDPATAADLFDAAEQDLLTNRNRDWMPRIATAAATHDRIVIAVGAAHLPGTDGVLNLLAADGWTITRLD
ncbi:hypothetical protein SAMN04488003_10872 [Loktanella fryxellensis]|uniref:TraB family protein n=1 Tax=Loktanella fryxellensis TaxID=245187 RepID=A0A1H8DA32_9RHOB|nr:TraB/GumN family protein [Loktanella fryxellensis]SEN04143.1 hypothetical protein SAMN04488003_10872 [Loktanella fryxellensis]